LKTPITLLCPIPTGNFYEFCKRLDGFQFSVLGFAGQGYNRAMVAGGRRPERHPKVKKLLRALEPYGPERVYLFGSWARGEADTLSDLDIVIIKRTAAPFFERLLEVGRLLPLELGGVDLLVYTPEEFAAMREQGNAFAEMVVEEGRLIYGREAPS
jgi:uncharacterized protein